MRGGIVRNRRVGGWRVWIGGVRRMGERSLGRTYEDGDGGEEELPCIVG